MDLVESFNYATASTTDTIVAATCNTCVHKQKNPNRLDRLDRKWVCPKLQNVLYLWFSPQVPDGFSCIHHQKNAGP